MKSCCTPESRDTSNNPARPGSLHTHGSSRIDFNPGEAGYDKSHFVSLTASTFLMGTDDSEGFPADGEGPVRKVDLSPFSISKYAITNGDFRLFVDETEYQTDSERYGWSYVFQGQVKKHLIKRGLAKKVPNLHWWYAVEGACWKKPTGPGSSIRNILDHPAVHISWNDATAYCRWAGTALPSEAQWEFAARGGLEQNKYAWGNTLRPGGKHMCNIWQGNFPDFNSAEDGFSWTCPVHSYQPNGFDLYCVAGNVWEWCADWFSPDHQEDRKKDPTGPLSGNTKVMRGGSFLCHKSYCNRYRVAARTSNTPNSACSNLGFRVVL